jgi:hypothetical protein
VASATRWCDDNMHDPNGWRNYEFICVKLMGLQRSHLDTANIAVPARVDRCDGYVRSKRYAAEF